MAAPSRARVLVAAVLPAALALGYSIAVVAAAWRAPDKGFVAFTGRRVVHATPAAGLRRGDVITSIDGEAVASTLHYSYRLLDRRPGDTVRIGFTREGAAGEVTITLRSAGVPIAALVATALALVLLILGLIARAGRPDDQAARRFHRTTIVYAALYAGALSWSHLVVHPILAAIFLVTLFVGPAIAMDFAFTFPARPAHPHRVARLLGYGPTLLLLVGGVTSFVIASVDYLAGRATDRGLYWLVGCVAGQLVHVVVQTIIGWSVQISTLRGMRGAERSQLRWITFGLALTTLPLVGAVPVAFLDLDLFLLVRYRPFLLAFAVFWAVSHSLAVLRVRLADVDAVIQRSLVYAVAAGAAVAVYIAVVLGVGLAAEQWLGYTGVAPHLMAAAAAAALFGPIRSRVNDWLDRRFFRDRRHYVQALRGVGEAVARVREPDDLAREVVERVVGALRASGGALYLRAADGTLKLARAHGEGTFAPDLPPAAGDGIMVGIGVPPVGALVLGPRRGGDLYSSQDRDLLGALASQLAVAVANAEAFGTIADMSRTLEKQNVEIRSLRDKLEDENRYLRGRVEAAVAGSAIVGSSRAVRELLRQIERAAPAAASILILGESGTGKGLVARALHAASPRAAAPFIHVDCGAIPAGVFESELFGHERGAFTGAVRLRRGHFELADGGTLFLDEIGELPLDLQPKLLRALQERSFLRLGGAEPVSVDVRILAATNRKLDDMVAAGAFREDLYYRLRVVEITVPPLRARRGDIPALCETFLPRACRRAHRPPRALSPEAAARLDAYGWPGNVRELENVLERAAVLCDGEVIQPEDLNLPDRPAPPDEELADGSAAPHVEVMDAIEKKRLIAALRAAGGNRSHAARALGMPRTTFINKLRRYGLLD